MLAQRRRGRRPRHALWRSAGDRGGRRRAARGREHGSRRARARREAARSTHPGAANVAIHGSAGWVRGRDGSPGAVVPRGRARIAGSGTFPAAPRDRRPRAVRPADAHAPRAAELNAASCSPAFGRPRRVAGRPSDRCEASDPVTVRDPWPHQPEQLAAPHARPAPDATPHTASDADAAIVPSLP